MRTFSTDYSRESKQSRFVELQSSTSDLQPGIANKTYLFCGDMGRGRTVRSLAYTIGQYPNVRLLFVSPGHETLRLDETIKKRLRNMRADIHEFDSLDASLDGQPILSLADAVYMTRIQREHNSAQDESDFSKIDFSQYQLTPARVATMKTYAPILHPFPRDSVMGEIPTTVDNDSRAMYFRQARNGMWARAALLVHLFDAADDLFMLHNAR
jgi:aspartate carbamoyltransferase catalytic subunit